MFNFSTEEVFLHENISPEEKQARLDTIKLQIEFVWLASYDTVDFYVITNRKNCLVAFSIILTCVRNETFFRIVS